MSAPRDEVTVRPGPPVGRRFQPGFDPRRNPGHVSAAEREFRRLLEAEQIPRANDLLTAVFDQAMGGDVKAAELFFKVCGLIKKPTDNEAIAGLASKLLDGMLAEARARRDAGRSGG